MKSDSIKEITTALVKAQGELRGAAKDSTNPFFNSNYANLESVWSACRKPLHDNGLAVFQFPDTVNGEFCLVTILAHTSGEWIMGNYPIKPTKSDPQSTGSAISYARRYALASMVGIYQTDDDGNAASEKAHSFISDARDTTFANPNLHELQNLETETFQVGKHTGKTFREVLEKDKGFNFKYADWVRGVVESKQQSDVHPSQLNFYKYAKLSGVYEVPK